VRTPLLRVPRNSNRSKNLNKEVHGALHFSRGHQRYDYKTPAEIYYDISEQAA
jgi:hypothetical protein